MSRVYAPLDLAMLDELVAGEEVEISLAFTVTPQLEESLSGLDEEELEHLATQLAAAACAGRPGAIVALEIAAPRIEPVLDVLAACTVSGVRMKDVVCLFIADEEFDEETYVELSWYDASEITAVREELTRQ